MKNQKACRDTAAKTEETIRMAERIQEAIGKIKKTATFEDDKRKRQDGIEEHKETEGTKDASERP